MRTMNRVLIASGIALAVAGVPLLSTGLSEGVRPKDLWVHPRTDAFDAARFVV